MQIRELEVPLKWGYLRGQIFGEPSNDKRPIVAFHGFLDNSNSFRPIAPYLVKNNKYYIISIDLPGHGQRYCIILNKAPSSDIYA